MPEPTSPQHLSKHFLNQEAVLWKAITDLANAIAELPHDPAYPNTDPRVYLVGGFVRDAVLGRLSTDADIEVYGVSQKQLERVLNDLFTGRVNTVGRAFAVYTIRIGEVSVLDVALPRKESATGSGHKDFEVHGDPGMTIEDAARRRDFTINAILTDPLTCEIVDPYHGLDDLGKKILRAIDPIHFIEDPLRVYRALQLAARYGLTIEPETQKLLRDMVENDSLDHLPPERITAEIKKLLLSPKPSLGFEIAKELGIVSRHYPELAALESTPQEPEWHPEGNVWIHTMIVVDEAALIIRDERYGVLPPYFLYVMLGALCHDLGKPETTAHVEGRIRSRGHEEAGKTAASSLLSRWCFGEEANRAAIAIAMNHLSPSQFLKSFSKKEITEKQLVNAIRRLIKRIHPCPWQAFIAACAADIRGRGGDHDAHVEEADRVRTAFAAFIAKQHLDTESQKTLVRGEDILALGIEAGPRVGALIKQIEQKRDEGKIETREEALDQLKKLIDMQ